MMRYACMVHFDTPCRGRTRRSPPPKIRSGEAGDPPAGGAGGGRGAPGHADLGRRARYEPGAMTNGFFRFPNPQTLKISNFS